MRSVLAILFLTFFTTAFTQEQVTLKRKYLGYYEGTIPSYRIVTGNQLMFVSEAKIEIQIGENQMQLKIGNNELFGNYSVMFEADNYYLLDVRIDGQLATERILVYKHGKHLSRDGLFPQPVADLEKVKKR